MLCGEVFAAHADSPYGDEYVARSPLREYKMNVSKKFSAPKKLCQCLIFLLLFGLSFQPALAQTNVVKLVSDPFPPYVMNEADTRGYVTEMVIKILEDAGYIAKYINIPFKRALLGLENGQYDGLLAVSPGRPGYIYTENSFGTSQTSFFVAKDSTWQYRGTPSLKSITLGVINGYEFSGGQPGEYENNIDAYILMNKQDRNLIQVVSGTDALNRLMQKLALGRIDATLEDASVFWFAAKKMGLSDKFKAAGDLNNPEKITVGFNLKNPRARELANVISDGIQKLKDSGEYNKILLQYDLKGH
jgi:polar amino acid transport system substrate-binding protein